MTAQLNGQPEAWVISLDERPDRLAAFRERAKAARLTVQELVVPRCTVARDGWGGSPQSCGCAQAHQALLSMGDGPLLVFEDDAMLPDNMHRWLDLAVQTMPAAWELCLFGAGMIITDARPNTWGAVPFRSFALSHAYWVSARGRPYLADCAREATGHWDFFASRWMGRRRQMYGFAPTVVRQDVALGSDIPDSRRPEQMWRARRSW